jgi:release factor glutamine methyltransferase
VRPAHVVRRASDYLARHDVRSPETTAEVLLASILQTDRAGLYTRADGLSSSEARAFGRALCLRCSGVPLQHLTGEGGFRRLTLEVRPGVFVPRPETEVLAAVAIDAIRSEPAPMVVDVGTGTGAIALAIADEVPAARVIATDLSREAVALARRNADRLGLAVEILHGDLFAPVDPSLRGRVDLVVSNPPYLAPSQHEELPPDVRADPPLALLGGRAVVDRLVAAASEWLRPGGGIALEIGSDQDGNVSAILGGRFRDVRVLPDLTGRDRVATGRRR